jgi:hypothetical protein
VTLSTCPSGDRADGIFDKIKKCVGHNLSPETVSYTGGYNYYINPS